MRNRAAQAAFRERRTEYIKHLELTIKHHEEQLSSLQQSSRNAAEEVLMLRYKTSLLERILLEKGIDVQMELRAFSQNEPTPTQTPTMMPVQQPQHRAQYQHSIHQQQAQHQQQLHRGSISRQAGKKGSISHGTPDAIYIKNSPTMQPTPESRSTSPNMHSPPDGTSYLPHSVVSTPASDFIASGSNSANCVTIPHNYYPSPYQTHMEELEQEYEAEILDDDQHGHSSPVPLDNPPHIHHHAHGSSNMNGSGHMVDHLAVTLQNGPPPSTSGSMGQQQQQGLHYNNFNLPFTFATSNLR